MTIRRGGDWGAPGTLPDDGVVVHSDAEAREAIEKARRMGRTPPVLGLAGGDLCRTLGGRGDTRRLRSAEATTFSVDVGEVLLDGRLHLFVAHLLLRNRWWTRVFLAMNAEWLGPLDVAPRAHPGDGLLDTFDATLGFGEILRVRGRARTGIHLPHRGIRERRTPAVQLGFDRPLSVWLDGVALGQVRSLSVRVQPDILTVVV